MGECVLYICPCLEEYAVNRAFVLPCQMVMPTAPKSVGSIVTKLAIDQLIWSPACTVLFYVYKCMVEGRAR